MTTRLSSAEQFSDLDVDLLVRSALQVGDSERRKILWQLLERSHFQSPPTGVDGLCWVWGGSTSGSGRGSGYGRVSHRGRTWAVHRLSYALCVGPLSPVHQIDHKCCCRACFNPAHLEQVTHLKNQTRRASRANTQLYSDGVPGYTPRTE